MEFDRFDSPDTTTKGLAFVQSEGHGHKYKEVYSDYEANFDNKNSLSSNAKDYQPYSAGENTSI